MRPGGRLAPGSALGELGRAPTEYEIVTHAMNHTTTRPLRWRWGRTRFGNRYLRRHRDEAAISVPDWNRFRDPDEMTYRKYNRVQDEAETFVDRVLDEYADRRRTDLDPRTRMARTGSRRCSRRSAFAVHGLQMSAAYLAQIAPASYITNAAAFQTGDELRRVQRWPADVAAPPRPPRTRFRGEDRERWERDREWQGARRAIERTFVARDWTKRSSR